MKNIIVTKEENKDITTLVIDFEGTKDKYNIVKDIEDLVKIRERLEGNYGE